MSSEVELLPCPLCGEPVSVHVSIREDDSRAPRDHRHYVIECEGCCLRLDHESPRWWSSAGAPPENFEDIETRARAIAAWNRRSPSPVPLPLPAPLPGSVETVPVAWREAITKVRAMLGQAGGTGTAGAQNSITEREVGGWVLDAVEDELSALYAETQAVEVNHK